MKLPMQGVRILEVAQFTFVPASGGILAEWGADVIKVEHAVTGDAQRGLVRVLGLDVIPNTSFFPIMEGPNRGKRSIGLDIGTPEGRDVLDELIKTADVFVTNFTLSARNKLKINVEDVRAINPQVIYMRGTAYGARGSVADEGGYDGTAFWARGGSAEAATAEGAERMVNQPTGAYGDNMGGMTIAGGIAAALYARNATGEPSVIDVNLLGVAAWTTQMSTNLAMMLGGPLPKPKMPANGASPGNPLSGSQQTSDGRWLSLVMLQPTRYWADFCERMGRPELITDPRFAGDALLQNAEAAGDIVHELIANMTLAEWKSKMDGADGPWALVQNAWEVGQDSALRENGFISEVIDYEGATRELITNPVQFDETPVQTKRAPQFAEHTDDILRELGKDEEEIINLKIAGAVT
jgi:crotonobetainyl-CoA:carnitine CoA-transferase CaiB-like acyl-CoA transferase